MQLNPFTIKLAGTNIAIKPLYRSTLRFCQAYLTQDEPDFSMAVTAEDICLERRKSEAEDEKMGIPVRRYPDEYLETLAVYRKIANRLVDYHTLLLHGSCIAVDGAGYLFTAKSGTGKSTHTRLWRERFGSRAVIVNDDKPLLKIEEGRVTAYGTPWDGKHHLSSNIGVPLKAICFLGRDHINHIEPVDAKDAYPMLLQRTYGTSDGIQTAKTLRLLDRLTNTVKIYALGCNMEQEAVMVSYRGMNMDKDG